MALSLPDKDKFAPVRFFAALILSLVGLTSLSQSRSELVLTSPDSISFFLAVDGTAVPDSAQVEFEIAAEPGDVLIDIITTDSIARDLSTSLTLEDNIRATYEITALRSGLTLLQVSRELIEFVPTGTEDEMYGDNDSSMYGYDSAVFIHNTNVADVALDMSAQQMDATAQNEYNRLCQSLYIGFFEKDKTKDALAFVDAHQLTVPNLTHILEMLEYEDNRLLVAKRSFSQLLDPENFLLTLDYFHLERSKKELETFFHDQGY